MPKSLLYPKKREVSPFSHTNFPFSQPYFHNGLYCGTYFGNLRLLEKNITNGRIFAIEAKTEKKGLKGIRYTKHTTLTAQWGVNYANVRAAQESIAANGGVRSNWFEHTEYDSIVRHKKDTSKLYLQIMNPNNFRTEYTLADGTPTTKAELIAMGAIKDEPSEKPITLIYSLDSIISIKYKENTISKENNKMEVAA